MQQNDHWEDLTSPNYLNTSSRPQSSEESRAAGVQEGRVASQTNWESSNCFHKRKQNDAGTQSLSAKKQTNPKSLF